MNILNVYPHNPENHAKNEEHWINSKKRWFEEVYPHLSEKDFNKYQNTNRCDLCNDDFGDPSVKHLNINRDILYAILCDNCNEIQSRIKDLDHAKEVLRFTKGKT